MGEDWKFGPFLDGHLEPPDFSWSSSEVLREAMEHAVRGGKKVRPLLCLKTCEMLGGDLGKARIVAEAVELFHNATLVHDDIEDGDRVRRGHPAVWVEYGTPDAINAGDALSDLSYRHIVSHREEFDAETFREVLDTFSSRRMEVIEGQALDLEFRKRGDVTEEEYMDMVEKKTGALVSASMECAAVIADANPEFREGVEEFGGYIGPAFQIRDDVMDLKGWDQGLGNDVREGKRSLPVVLAMQILGGEDGGRLLEILDLDRDKTTDEHVSEAVELMESVDTVEEANDRAVELASRAIQVLEGLPEDCPTADLEAITEFFVERRF